MPDEVRRAHLIEGHGGLMTAPATYEIIIKGRASARFLRPLLNDFTVDHPVDGVTRLIGEIRDAAHLHGVIAHLTSLNVELVSIAPSALPLAAPLTTECPPTQNESSNNS
jgi:hypothetical protein